MLDRAMDVARGPQRRSQQAVGLDRFGAFSDGVYAIAITLLVLELSVPSEVPSLTRALFEQWPEFLGYLISFAFIGGSWVTHSRVTVLMRAADAPAAGLNLIALLLVAILPFTTSLMVVNLGGAATGEGVLIYGINVLLASVALSLVLLYVSRQRELLVDDVADDDLRDLVRARWIAIAINAVALAAAFVAPLGAVVMYLVVTLLVLVTPVLRLRRTPATG